GREGGGGGGRGGVIGGGGGEGGGTGPARIGGVGHGSRDRIDVADLAVLRRSDDGDAAGDQVLVAVGVLVVGDDVDGDGRRPIGLGEVRCGAGEVDPDEHRRRQGGGAGIVRHGVPEAVGAGEAGGRGVGKGAVRVQHGGAVLRVTQSRHEGAAAQGRIDVLVAVRIGVVLQHPDRNGRGPVGVDPVIAGDGAVDAHAHQGRCRGGAVAE